MSILFLIMSLILKIIVVFDAKMRLKRCKVMVTVP